jgi:hypothetical protein
VRKLASRLHARLDTELIEGADAERMTSAVLALWVDISAVLAPIIGALGMNALFRRALSVSAATSPVLALALHESGSQTDFAGLRIALARQSVVEIARSNAELLRTFTELLATLIGEPLTERLLNHVPAVAASGHSPQEPPT